MDKEIKIPIDLTLNGSLVVLRPPMETDYPALQVILGDPMTMRYLQFLVQCDQGGMTIEKISNRYAKFILEQKDQTRANFIIRSRKNNDIVGSCSLKNIDLDHRNAEFGIIVHHAYWGKGIAAESHLLTLEYGFEKLGLHRIEFITLAINKQMRGFFDRAGISFEGTKKDLFIENGKFVDGTTHVVLEKDWKSVKDSLKNRISAQI